MIWQIPLALFAFVAASDAEFQKPSFCRDLDCPPFDTVKKFDGFEERRYAASRWVSTNISVISNPSEHIKFSKDISEGFFRLFNYIQGDNVDKRKINMTAPVRTKVTPGEGPACETNLTISFMVPLHERTPPQPSKRNVFLRNDPGSVQYVKSFGGFASDEEWEQCVVQLENQASSAGLAVRRDFYYVAGYDSPFTLFNRHNECWVTAAHQSIFLTQN